MQDVNGLHFIVMMMTAMTQIGPTIHVFSGDMPMYMREHKNGMYSITALFVTRNIADLPQQVASLALIEAL